MNARLYRSKSDEMVGGVCGGLAKYLGIDPTIVRLVFLLLLLGSGVGFMLYLILWIVIPYEGQGEAGTADAAGAGANEIADRMRQMGADVQKAIQQPNPQAGLLIGGALVIVGVLALLDNLNLPWLRWVRFDMFWPVLLIIAGAALIWRRLRRD